MSGLSKSIKNRIGKLAATLGIAALALLIVFLLSFSLFISSDLLRSDMVEKYRSDTSFFYRLPSGAMAHIRDEGNRDGPPLFLIHGSNASLHTWEPWVEELGDRYRLISFDLPGHGLTGQTAEDDYSIDAMVRFTKQIADLFKLDRVTLAGNSMGGAVALKFALDYPRNTEALVLVSPAGMPRDAEDTAVGAFRLTDKAWGRALMRYVTPKFAAGSTLRGVVADPDNFVTDEMVTRYWELLRMTGSREATIKRFSIPRRPFANRLDDIRAPTLILWGQQDPLIKVKYGIRMNGAIAGSLLKIYPQAGHLAHEEIPTVTATDTRRFFREVFSE